MIIIWFSLKVKNQQVDVANEKTEWNGNRK